MALLLGETAKRAKMWVWCNKIPNVSFPTFIKHLPALNPRIWNPNGDYRNTLTTTRSFNCARYETLSSIQKEQISLYVDALLQWNQRMNLTAVTKAGEVMKRHVEDSLAIIPPIQDSYLAHCDSSCHNLDLVDVGSGAGLPGLVLAIACPGWKVTLLESLNKRCLFMEHAVGLTGLKNVQVLRARAEDSVWDKILISERCLM